METPIPTVAAPSFEEKSSSSLFASSSPSSSHEGYVGAVALNNIAVTFMQRSRNYRYSGGTLREAVVAMKQAVQYANTSTTTMTTPGGLKISDTALSRTCMNQKIQKAFQHLVAVSGGSSRSSSSPVSSFGEDTKTRRQNRTTPPITFIKDQLVIPGCVRAAMIDGILSLAPVCEPILIDMQQQQQTCSYKRAKTREFDIESAIVLYNLAISQLKLSQLCTATTAKRRLQMSSKKLLSMALSVLSANCNIFQIQHIHELHTNDGEARLLLTAIVLNNLCNIDVKISSSSSCTEHNYISSNDGDGSPQFSIYWKQLCYVRNIIFEWNTSLEKHMGLAPAA